jgi:hypothetical protein
MRGGRSFAFLLANGYPFQPRIGGSAEGVEFRVDRSIGGILSLHLEDERLLVAHEANEVKPRQLCQFA